MSLRAFVKWHRDALSRYIREKVPNLRTLDDADRAEWVRNDETLYNWARSEGVRL
jgi:hypothetical protein